MGGGMSMERGLRERKKKKKEKRLFM